MHNFILAVLVKMGLGSDLIQWVRTLLNDQQSCVMNNSKQLNTSSLIEAQDRGDPLSAYLFAVAIEVLFIMIRKKRRY